MEPDNQTSSSEFILLGLSEKPEQETLLFALFLSMYVVTVVEPVVHPGHQHRLHLHTPTFSFVANIPWLISAWPPTLSPRCW